MAIQEKMVEGFRLSSQQRALWLQQQEGVHGHAQCAVLIEGPLHRDRLRAALETLVERHEILRTTLHLQPGVKVPLQVIQEEPEVLWEIAAAPDAGPATLDRILKQERRRPFDLAELPVLRALLLELAPDRHLLVLTLPALAADGRTLLALLGEMSSLYAEEGLEGDPLQYADFAEWQHELWATDENGAMAKAEAWRREALALLPLRLPFERRDGSALGFAPEVCRLPVADEVARKVSALAGELEATTGAVLAAAWQAVLARFAGDWDLCLVCLFEGRGYEELEGGSGPYARWIPIPSHPRPDEEIAAAVSRVQAQLSEVADWQHYFVPGDPEDSRGPEICFEHAVLPPPWSAGRIRFSLASRSVQVERFRLKLSCLETGGALVAELHYDAALFRREDMEGFGRCFLRLLESAAERPGAAVAELEILAEPLEAPEPAAAEEGRGLHRRFEEQASRQPERPAVFFEGEELSYGELNARANRLARHLQRLGAGPDSVVALFLERSPAVIEALLAALKAGAAYAVIEPTLPGKRVAAMLEDLCPPVVVTTEALAAALPRGGGRVLVLDQEAAALARESAADLPGEDLPSSLAYVIFTSGSTGRPKGVAVEHRQILAYLQGAMERLELPAGGRFATVSTFAADLGHTMLFPALCLGGCVHVVSQDRLADATALADELGQHPVDCLKIVPSHLRALLTAVPDERLLPRQRLVLGGEASSWDLIDRVRDLAPGCQVFNHYGPSETTVGVLAGPLGREEGERPAAPPLGWALSAARVYLLDRHLRPVPSWVAGDLYVGGTTVSRGYLGRPDLTAGAFLPDPFAGPGARMYRTGDRARHRPDGRFEFLGRGDGQVKFHGFRIELEEVRAALVRHPLIADGLVRLVGEGTACEMVAYYVSREELEPAGLRALLGESLQAEVLPNIFVRLDRLPLTPNGKIDIGALPSPEEAMSRARRAPVPARTPTEETLARLWAEVLGRSEPPGVYDNFFELGGHSLLATQLMARVCEIFHISLPLRTLLEDPVVAGLAEAVARERARAGESQAEPVAALPALVPDPVRRHEPFPLTEVQQAYWVGRSGAFELGGVSTHSYMELDSADLDLPRLEAALRKVIDRHEMLRAIILPDGTQRILEEVPPYTIEILDLRGHAAAEVEERLAEKRERLSHLMLQTDRWPLFDFRATLMDGGRVRLHVSRDALIFDAWSALIFFRELVHFYKEPAAELPPVEVSYRDYVLAEEALRQTDLYRRDWEYWQRRIAQLPPAPDLPLAGNPASLGEPRFTRRSGTLPVESWERLKARAARSGLTPSGLALAVYSDILTLWSKSPRFTLNLTLFHRLPLHAQVHDVVGDFTSLTLLEVDNSVPAPFVLRARRLQERLWEDLEHRHVSGVRVLRELARQQRRSGSALMPVVLTSTLALDIPSRDVSLRALSAEIAYGLAITSQVWLDHSVSEQEDGGLIFHWNAVEGLFPAGMLDSMFAAYQALLDRLAADDTSWLTETLPWLPEAELEVRRAANATAAPVPQGLLHEPFLQRAAEQPDWPAVIDSRRTLGYGELARRARGLGRLLRAHGARPNQLVAVVMEKGWEQVAAVLGVLASGAAYLPVDPALPRERRFSLLERGEAVLALTQPWLVDRLEWPEGVRVLAVDEREPEPGPDDVELEPVQRPLDLAYVLFTSGSTGQPKGVMIDHRGALNTCVDVNQRFGVGPRDRVLALSALGFDLSVWDIFGLLAAGGTVVLPETAASRDPGRWAELVERQGVTLWNTVPALLEMLTEYAANRAAAPRLDSLRQALLSGDWIPLALPDRFRALVPGARLCSLGGATEASIWSIAFPVEQVDPAWPSIPYGRPMLSQTFHVLDDFLEPRPTWVPGHLYIGGIGLAQGYWRDEEKTRASFIEHPRTHERLYRTGDLGRYLPGGDIEFLGREDYQVKIQGHRIELGEIEATLEQHSAVRAGVVTAPGERESRRLVAYVVLREDAATGAAAPQPEIADDGMERLRFKLSEPGIRADLGGQGVALECSGAALALTRRSTREFLREPLPAARLGRLLGVLQQVRPEGWPLPRYRYASASGLYPVQAYLYVKPGRVEGLDGGTWYYHPREHRLLPVSPGDGFSRDLYSSINRPVFDRAAFGIFLVAQMRAIRPLYGEAAAHYATLEAGLITQLLETLAPEAGIGLCQMGGLDFDRVRPLFALDDDHVLVHSLLGGGLDPAAKPALDPAELALIESLRGSSPAGPAGPTEETAVVASLREHLRAKLPEYMVPPTFVFLDSLPLTANGKVDRGALPLPGSAPEEETPARRVAPESELEQAIAAIWQEVLGLDQVSVNDNFFDLGGNSVGMIQVHGRLVRALGRDLPITQVFRYSTIGSLAAAIADESGSAAAVESAREAAAKQREAAERQRRRMRERFQTHE